MPKLGWGWWVNAVPPWLDKKVFSIFRKVADVHNMASKPLRILLNGHVFSLPFMAFQQSFMALRSSGMPWGNGNGSWFLRVKATLQLWDWQHVGPWKWHHELSCDDMALVLHKVRLFWRRVCWREFCQQDRRDSRMFSEIQFSPERCKAASKMFGEVSQHGRAVLSGAALSLSCYQVMYEGRAAPGCSLCHDDSVFPSWYHLPSCLEVSGLCRWSAAGAH
jgi:hypothetical protein